MSVALPSGLHFFERGWLSSNAILLDDGKSSVLVDSGYFTHAPLLMAYLSSHLLKRPLDFLVNSHLHSDHCGGNHAVQSAYPFVDILIPYGLFDAVMQWDVDKLSFQSTGQSCPQFLPHKSLRPGDLCAWAGFEWEIHAAPGHDHDALLFFNPQHRILISADSLWAHGFGIVFPEIMGGSGFDEVNNTLHLIEELDPVLVMPGHGPLITDVKHSLELAYERLNFFAKSPVMHASHAAKVLLKFKLLELQAIEKKEFIDWAISTPLIADLHRSFFCNSSIHDWLNTLLFELTAKKAATFDNEFIRNS